MRSVERRVRRAERRRLDAGFSNYDGWSEERIAAEILRFCRIIHTTADDGPEGKLSLLFERCSVPEFQKVIAAMQARNAANPDPDCQDGIGTEKPDAADARFQFALEDFEMAGLPVEAMLAPPRDG